ncbi:hypothetical protein BH18ACT5_BH18ACT5_17780 [soil metagenome]
MLKNDRRNAELSVVEWKRARSRVGLALLLAVLVLAAPAALAQEFVPGQPFDPNRIVFPVVGGPLTFIDDFSQARSGGRTHGATDIMALGVKGYPVVAAADGVISWIGGSCCYLAIDHGGGYETWYIHRNNDNPGTDDGLGWGIADGVTRGTVVTQGQLIGWVGDSGNAETVGPHLHFEIRLNDVPINPYQYLLTAPHLTAPGGSAAAPVVLANTFTDDNGNPHEANIEKLYASGITVGCGGGRYCPLAPITRGQIALFIHRLLGGAASGGDYYDDDNGSVYEEAVNAITQAGIGFGCGEREYCPETGLRRDEMAELLTRTFDLAPSTSDFFGDDEGSGFEAAINALRQAGITIGCDPNNPGSYCPNRILTRDEMASFFARSMDL